MSVDKKMYLLLVACLLPGMVLAHSESGIALHVHSWDVQAGWLHPFSGTDHWLAMLALGLWAGQLGGRSRWILPAVFVGCLLAGGLVAMAGVALPAVEPVILMSLLAFGLLIASAASLPGSFAVAVTGIIALFHGAAHGVEIPADVAPLAYAAGFVLASATLHVAGIALASGSRLAGATTLTRLAGTGIAATGVLLLIA